MSYTNLDGKQSYCNSESFKGNIAKRSISKNEICYCNPSEYSCNPMEYSYKSAINKFVVGHYLIPETTPFGIYKIGDNFMLMYENCTIEICEDDVIRHEAAVSKLSYLRYDNRLIYMNMKSFIFYDCELNKIIYVCESIKLEYCLPDNFKYFIRMIYLDFCGGNPLLPLVEYVNTDNWIVRWNINCHKFDYVQELHRVGNFIYEASSKWSYIAHDDLPYVVRCDQKDIANILLDVNNNHIIMKHDGTYCDTYGCTIDINDVLFKKQVKSARNV